MKDRYYIFDSETVGTFAVCAKTDEEAFTIAATVTDDADVWYYTELWEIDDLGLDVF